MPDAPAPAHAAAPAAPASPLLDTTKEAPAADAAPDKLAGARRVAAQRLAAQRAAQQAQQSQQATAAQLAQERAARAEAHAKAEALAKRIAELEEDPIERWRKEGLTPEQVRAKLQSVDDPVAKELAAIRAERQAEKEAAQKEKDAAESRRLAALKAQTREKAVSDFVSLRDKLEDKVPHLANLPAEELVGAAEALLDATAREKSRRTRRPVAECRQDPYTDEQILLALHARIDERAAARKAKATPVAEEAPKATGAAPGTKTAPTASRTADKKTDAAAKPLPKDFSSVDWDSLSDKEQFALMGRMLEANGRAFKKKVVK